MRDKAANFEFLRDAAFWRAEHERRASATPTRTLAFRLLSHAVTVIDRLLSKDTPWRLDHVVTEKSTHGTDSCLVAWSAETGKTHLITARTFGTLCYLDNVPHWLGHQGALLDIATVVANDLERATGEAMGT